MTELVLNLGAMIGYLAIALTLAGIARRPRGARRRHSGFHSATAPLVPAESARAHSRRTRTHSLDNGATLD